MNRFSERLALLRDRDGLTQQELANVVGVSRTAIASYERVGKQPSYDILISIAAHFHVTTDYLLGVSDKEIEKDTSEYLIKRIDELFPNLDDKLFSDSGLLGELYDVVMKSYDYGIPFCVVDALADIFEYFSSLYYYIDESHKKFDSANLENSKLDKNELMGNYFSKEMNDVLFDIQNALSKVFDFCSGILGTTYRDKHIDYARGLSRAQRGSDDYCPPKCRPRKKRSDGDGHNPEAE